jgi:hypothetical protein
MGVAVFVGERVEVGMGVLVGVVVQVGLGVGVDVGVNVGVAVGRSVRVGDAVQVGRGVFVEVRVQFGMGVLVDVGVTESAAIKVSLRTVLTAEVAAARSRVAVGPVSDEVGDASSVWLGVPVAGRSVSVDEGTDVLIGGAVHVGEGAKKGIDGRY